MSNPAARKPETKKILPEGIAEYFFTATEEDQISNFWSVVGKLEDVEGDMQKLAQLALAVAQQLKAMAPSNECKRVPDYLEAAVRVHYRLPWPEREVFPSTEFALGHTKTSLRLGLFSAVVPERFWEKEGAALSYLQGVLTAIGGIAGSSKKRNQVVSHLMSEVCVDKEMLLRMVEASARGLVVALQMPMASRTHEHHSLIDCAKKLSRRMGGSAWLGAFHNGGPREFGGMSTRGWVFAEEIKKWTPEIGGGAV